MALLYMLSIITMVLISMAIHEMGHLVTARMARAKVNRFQIGIGWNIATLYSGKTWVRTTPETEMPTGSPLRPGDVVCVYVEREPGHREYTALAVMPGTGSGATPEEFRDLIQLPGRVRQTDPGGIVLADMAWSLRAIPILAGINIIEDPRRQDPQAHNVIPWSKQVAITLAGPLANIAITAASLALAASLTFPGTPQGTWAVVGLEPGGTGMRAGMEPGDRILRAGDTIYPTPEETGREIGRAAARGKSTTLGIERNGRLMDLRVRMRPGERRAGVRLELRETLRTERPMNPTAVAERVWSLWARYTGTVLDTFRWNKGGETGNRTALSGPITSSYQMAHTVNRTGLTGWLMILATLNLLLAACNLIPMPPQDGYRILAESIQALRKGKPVHPKVELAMFIGGIACIVSGTAYLLTLDILRAT